MHFPRAKILALASLISLFVIAAASAACSQGSTIDDTPAPQTIKPGEFTANLNPADCPPQSAAKQITGAGATFPDPLYQTWFAEWNKLCGSEVNYQAVGSGAGIQQISEKNVDFGASDAIMTEEQKSQAGGKINAIPTTSDALAVIYNIPGVENKQITLDGATLADIFLGNITSWNDPKIKTLNPNTFIPEGDITVVHRSDGSGTTAIFTNYLSQVSPQWKSEIGAGTAVLWKVGSGGNGNSGVASTVQQLTNSIGYVSLAYAKQNKINYALMKNSSGKAIEPSLESARAAERGVALPDNMEVVITNSSNADAYPITGFTWLLVYAEQTDKAKATQLGDMINWALSPTGGQQYCEHLDYVPLDDAARTKALALLADTKYQGTPIAELP